MKWLALLGALVLASYVAYTVAYPTYSYRYRITVEVNTTDGMKSGSSVLEVTTIQFPSWLTLGNNNFETTTRGEAVFVDLGNGRNLVSLLALGPNAEDGAHRFFAPRSYLGVAGSSTGDIQWSKQLSTMSGRRKFAGDADPTLVTFGSLADPSAVQVVPFGNPQTILGPDVRSVHAWIDLTADPVTDRLIGKLPWISNAESAIIAYRIINAGHPGSSSPLGIFRRK